MFCGLSYWFFPLFSAIVWFFGLWAMLIVWLVEGRPHYVSMEAGQTIAYISDVGASNVHALFIVISVLMTVSLDIAFFSERWLRHKRRLTPNYGTAEKVLSALAILFAVLGTVGLICLSGPFDTVSHPRLHDGFLLMFMGGFVISAILICAEYGSLRKHYKHHRVLVIGFWIKLIFVVTEIALAIVFGALLFRGDKNVGAVFEWIVAFVFTFYILTFVVDLLPVVHVKGRGDERMGEVIDEGADARGDGGQPAMSDEGGRGYEMNENRLSKQRV